MRWSQVSPKVKTFPQWMKTPPSFTHKNPAKKEQGMRGAQVRTRKYMVHVEVSLKQKTSKQIGTISKRMLQVRSHWNGISKLNIQSNHNTLPPSTQKENPKFSHHWINDEVTLLSLNKHYKTHTNIIDSHQHWRNLTDRQNIREFKVPPDTNEIVTLFFP